MPIDGISLVPYLRDASVASLRRFVFQGVWRPIGKVKRTREEWMLRDATHKLRRRCVGADCTEELYRLEGVVDGAPLVDDGSAADAAARQRLGAELDRILAEG